MHDEATPIARLRLARDPLRLLAAPLVFGLAGAAAIVAGAALVGGTPGLALLVAGSLAIVGAGYLAAFVFSVSAEIEPGTIHLRWLGGERRYALVRGNVTRVTLRGAGAAPLRTRFGAIGWALGSAELGGGERIEVVRLAPTPTMILVPTDFGRLAIAAASEPELIEALGSAARVQQRLEASARPAPVAPAPPAPAPTPPRPLTGIERSLLEERLAAQRAAAQAAAMEERRAAERAAARAAAEVASEVTPAPVPVPAPAAAAVVEPAVEPAPAPRTRARRPRERVRRRTAWQPPAWLRWRRGPAVAGAGTAAMTAAATTGAPAIAAPARAVAVARPAPSVRAVPVTRIAAGDLVLVALPLLAAAATWVVSLTMGATLLPSEQRLLALGLVAAGPLGSLGTLAARAWQPRLGPLVALSALAAVAIVARAVVG